MNIKKIIFYLSPLFIALPSSYPSQLEEKKSILLKKTKKDFLFFERVKKRGFKIFNAPLPRRYFLPLHIIMLIIPLSIAVIFDKLKITKWTHKIIFGLFPLLDTFLLHFRGNDANLSKLWHLPQLLGIGIFAINGFFPKSSLKKVKKIYGYLFWMGYLLPLIYPIWAPSLSDNETRA